MKNATSFIIGLGIGIAALYYTLLHVSFQELGEVFIAVNWYFIFLTAVIMALTYVPRAFRWKLLIFPIKEVNAFKLFSPMMIGFMGNFFPARAGEFLRAYFCSKKIGIPFSGSFATIVIERLCDLIVLYLLFLWILLFRAEIIKPGITFSGLSLETIVISFGTITIILALLIIIFIYLLLKKSDWIEVLANFALKFSPKVWQEKIRQFLKEFALGMQSVKTVGCWLKLMAWSFLAWTPMILAFYPLSLAFGVDDLTLESFIIIRVLVSIMITVLPTPAFLGSFSAGVFIALHEIMGKPEAISASLGLAGWALNTIVVFIGGFFFLLYDQIKIKELKNF
jgi:glycosyltransferase 2 family protein